jgi:hypothetical protein
MNFIVWNSFPQHALEKKDVPIPSASPFLFQNCEFQMELSNHGILRIVCASKLGDGGLQVIWESDSNLVNNSSSSSPIHLLGESNSKWWKPNQLLPTNHPIYNKTESHQLIFNDVVGQLQVWQRISNNENKLTWQSSSLVAGDGPWYCVLNGLGFLVILDRSRQVIWSSTYLENDATVSPRNIDIKGLGNEEIPQKVGLHLTADGEVHLCESLKSGPYWHSVIYTCPKEVHLDAGLSLDGKPATPEERKEGKAVESETERNGYASQSIEEWFQYRGGYKRIVNRLCLIGTDCLVSHQKLCSLTDGSVLQLLPVPANRSEIRSMLFLDSTKVIVYYLLFLKPISIFTPRKVETLDPDFLTYNILSRADDSSPLEEKDKPLSLWLWNKTLCLSTFQGVILAKKNIDLLTSELQIQ